MKRSDLIHNTTTYWLTQFGLFFVENNEFIKIANQNKRIEYIKKPKHKIESFYIVQNGSLSEVNSGNLLYIDKNLNKNLKIKIGNSRIINHIDNNLFRFTEKIKRKVLKNGICDGSGKILWSFEESVRRRGWDTELMIYSKYLDNKEIFKRDILNGATIWTFNVSEISKYSDHEGEHPGEIQGKIRLWNNYLLLPLTGNKLIALDYTTGKIIWETMAMFGNYEIYNNQIVYFYEGRLLEIDPSNGQTTRDINLEQYLKKEQGIDRISGFKIENDRIYFTDYRKFKIGILDYKSLKLIDLITIEHSDNAWQIGDLQVQNRKIYVLEYLENNDRNLHIYEDDTL